MEGIAKKVFYRIKQMKMKKKISIAVAYVNHQ